MVQFAKLVVVGYILSESVACAFAVLLCRSWQFPLNAFSTCNRLKRDQQKSANPSSRCMREHKPGERSEHENKREHQNDKQCTSKGVHVAWAIDLRWSSW